MRWPTKLGRPSEWRERPIRKCLKFGMIAAGESIEDKFKIARDAGFEGVEMDSPNGFDTDEVIAARDAAGIEIPGVVDSVHWAKPLSDPDPAVRTAGRHALETAILDCKAYGGTQVLLVPAVVNERVSYGEAYERSQAEIRRVLGFAYEQRVSIAIENVWNNFLLSPLEARRYVEELIGRNVAFRGMAAGGDSPFAMSRPLVGWFFDVGNIWAYGWPHHWLEALGPGLVLRLDIKGYSRAKADKEGKWAGFGVEIGDGDVPWWSVRAWIEETNWFGWASAEVGGGDLARLKVISARMDRVLGIESE